ncbi:unnamed protein product, partial [marine sediment metagenome]
KVEKEGGKRIWQVIWQPVYKKQLPPGRKDYHFDAEEMKQPWLLGSDGKKIIWWPARNTHESLDTLRAEDPWLFAGQQLLNPVDVEDELKPFPIKYMHITPADKFSCIPVVNCTTTVDTAETQSDTSSFTVITTCAWTASGCCYVIDVKRGRFQPSEIVTLILLVWHIYHPVRIAIEKTSFVRGLEVSLRRACDVRKIHLPIELIPRDNQTAKEDRILMTL